MFVRLERGFWVSRELLITEEYSVLIISEYYISLYALPTEY